MTKHAFISYKSDYANFTIQLATDLKNAGFRVWVDKLQGAMAGEEWLAAIGEGLENSSALIAVITPEYFTSQYCKDELSYAYTHNIPIIPIMLRKTNLKNIPKNFFWLENIQYTSFENYANDQQIYEDGLAKIQDRLRKIDSAFEGPVPEAEAQYLNTLIGELTKWQGVEEYIALQAEAQQRPNPQEKRIDPALAVVIKEAKKQEETELKIEPLKNIAEAVEKLPRFVLIGDPGAGKTTTLRYLALEQARRRLAWLEAGRNGPPPPIPHIVYLPQWQDGQTPLAFVQSQWTLGGDLAHELQKGNVWLYLDGLNEMGAKGPEKADKLRKWLKAANAPQHVIVTCRKDDYNEALDLQQNTVLVKPLEDEQIRAFAARYLPEEKVEPFLARIFPRSGREEHRSLIHLARNPYMLAALLTVYEHQGELPTNTGALFHTLAQVLWERERLRNTRGWVAFEQMRERFGQLAFAMIDTDQPLDVSTAYALEHIKNKGLLKTVKKYLAVVVNFDLKHIKDEDLLKAGASAGFIRLNQDSVRFSHQLMLEYFAAWGLQDIDVKTRIRPPEFSWFGGRRAQKWDEVVVALCGIVDDASDLISQIAEVDLFFAADCIGSGIKISSACQSAIVTQLMQALKDEDGDVRRAAAEALVQIGKPAVPQLIQALKDEDARVRFRAAVALGKIGDAQAVPALIQALKDEDGKVLSAAAEALGKIGQPAMSQLIQALKDEDGKVRQAAAGGLGKIGDAQALPQLIQALKDEDSWVRRAAARGLGEIGDAQALPHLIQALQDKDGKIRSAAAEALGKIGDAQALPQLIQALKDEDSWARGAAAWALGEIGNTQAVPHLIQALKDEDWEMRQAAAEALGKIGDAQAVPQLSQALKDEDGDIRSAAAEALVKIGQPAVPALIQALKDEDEWVRRTAAEALGQIGDAQAVPHLIQALQDEDGDVRRAAAEALGKIGDAQAVPHLSQALKDEESDVRRAAAEALMRIGTDEALEALRRW